MEYSNNFSKTFERLFQFCIDDPNDIITNSEPFKFRSKFLDNTYNDGIMNAKIAAPLKYWSNFCRTLELSLINCEINFILTCSANCVISKGDTATTFAITDTKFYVSVATLSTQDNTKLLQQVKSRCKRTINWNKYQSKVTT